MNLENQMQMCTTVAQVVSKLGFTKYRRHDAQDRSIFLFAISNQGVSTEESWKTFPVMIEVDSKFIRVKTIFSWKNQAFTFEDDQLQQTVSEFIARANLWLKIGCFKFNSIKRHLFYESQSLYSTFPQESWSEMISPLLSYNISTYKSYIYGVVRLVEQQGSQGQWDLKKLVQLCERRPNSQYLPREEAKEQVNSDTLSGSDSSTSSASFESMEDEDYTLTEENFLEEVALLRLLQQNEEIVKILYLDGLRIDEGSKKIEYDNQDFVSFAEVFTSQQSCYDYLDVAREICNKLISAGFFLLRFPCQQLIILESKSIGESVKLKVKNLHKVITTKQILPQSAYLNALIQSFQSQIKLYKYRRMYEWSGDDYILSSALDYQELTNQQLLIGNGGFCQIYRNSMCGMDVAIKIMKDKKDINKTNLKRLKKEYWMLKTLQHPNILRCLGYSKYKSNYCLILERCSNNSLNQYLRKNSLTIVQKLRIASILAGAIEYIHYKGICHFDIKPQNILLNDYLEPKLCDFGLSAMADTDQNPGYTLLYSSPEQMAGQDPSFAADVWSFGMTLYYLFTLMSPYSNLINKNQKLQKQEFYEHLVSRQTPSVPEELYESCPEVVEILQSCWDFDTEKRPGIRTLRQKLRELSNCY